MLKIMMGGGGGGESIIPIILHNGKKSRGRKRVAEVTAGMSRADENTNAARNKRCNR